MDFSTNQTPCYFVHIPKTAGTSIRVLVEGLYSAEDRCDSWIGQDILKVLPWKLRQYKFIAGHYNLSYLKWLSLGNNRTVITFLREPIQRTVSHYFYLRDYKDSVLQALAESITIDQFIRKPEGVYELANLQTRYLGSDDLDDEFSIIRTDICPDFAERFVSGPWIDLTYERAVKNLEKCYVLGIVERMPHSLLLLASKLGLSPEVELTNQNTKNNQVKKIEPQTLECLVNINKYDIMLYAAANSILTEKLRNISIADVSFSYNKRFLGCGTSESLYYTPLHSGFCYGWHGVEYFQDSRPFRWSANKESYIDFPRLADSKEYRIAFRLGFFLDEQVNGFTFLVDGEAMPLEMTRCNTDNLNEFMYITNIKSFHSCISGDYTRISFRVENVINPLRDLGINDNRDLGLNLQWLSIEQCFLE